MAAVPVRPTRMPSRGRAGAGERSSAAVSPTTMTAGASTPAVRVLSPMSASVPRTVAGWRLFPPDTTAAGVSGAFPAAISRAAMASRFPRPMRITSVPPQRAASSRSAGRPSAAVWPVTMWTLRLICRWVTGMPAAPGMAMAEEMPGTTSQGMPAFSSASSSSPPRPKTKGSPPFSLTTVFPCFARRISAAVISSWAAECFPLRLPI